MIILSDDAIRQPLNDAIQCRDDLNLTMILMNDIDDQQNDFSKKESNLMTIFSQRFLPPPGLVLSCLFTFGLAVWLSFPAFAGWEGSWETADSWGGSYRIDVYPDGTAMTDYAEGWKGQWHEAEGGSLVIEWDSGWRDYIFNGVMGRQRLASKEGQRGYSSYMHPLEE